MTVAIDEDAAVDVIAQRRVDALSDHRLDTGELDLLVLDPVVVVDHERFDDRVLASLGGSKVVVEEVEAHLGRPDPREVRPTSSVVEARGQDGSSRPAEGPWQSHFAHRVRRRGLGPSLTSHCRIPQQP